jgi:hypothetical protein
MCGASMGNPLSTEECRKVAAEFSDRAKSASSAFLRRYYQRVVKRYLLLAEGDLRSAERDSVSASIAATVPLFRFSLSSSV